MHHHATISVFLIPSEAVTLSAFLISRCATDHRAPEWKYALPIVYGIKAVSFGVCWKGNDLSQNCLLMIQLLYIPQTQLLFPKMDVYNGHLHVP